jgi:hypothetical protein
MICNCELVAFTVKVAGLLITLPALSLTAMENCAPLSDSVVAAVVYAVEVAPMIAMPFLCH